MNTIITAKIFFPLFSLPLRFSNNFFFNYGERNVLPVVNSWEEQQNWKEWSSFEQRVKKKVSHFFTASNIHIDEVFCVKKNWKLENIFKFVDDVLFFFVSSVLHHCHHLGSCFCYCWCYGCGFFFMSSLT